MNTPCEKTEVIDIILSEIKEIKADVKEMIKFQSKIIGVVAAVFSISTLLGFLTGILINIYQVKHP